MSDLSSSCRLMLPAANSEGCNSESMASSKRQTNRYDHFIFSKTRLRELTPDLQKKAEVELNENPEKRMAEIHELRQMILECDPPINIDTSDAYLIRYLRTAKFDKNRALKTIKNFFKTKENNRDIFNDHILPSCYREVFQSNFLTFLPQRDPEGRPLLFFTLSKWDVKTVSVEDIYRVLYIMCEKLLQDESVQIRGVVVILDIEGVALQHIRLFRPILAYKLISTVQDGFPVRLKGVHIVKENSIIDLIWPIVKTFFKPKNKKRIFFHGHDLNSLYKYIPRKCLPTELGGTQGPLDTREWYQILHESEEEFVQKLDFGYVR